MNVIHISELVDYDEFCPYCDEHTLYLEFDETDLDGVPTDSGVHVHCKNERGNDHSDMPYVYWLPVQRRAAQWAALNIRIVWEDERQKLADWSAGKPLPGGL